MSKKKISNGSKFSLKVDRNIYPEPEYRFPNAKIGLTYKDSVADFPQPKPAPENAPNTEKRQL